MTSDRGIPVDSATQGLTIRYGPPWRPPGVRNQCGWRNCLSSRQRRTLANDTEHYEWISFLKNGLDDWFANRYDVFAAADLLWYPVEGRPDIPKAPDVTVVLGRPAGPRDSYQQWKEASRPPHVVFEFLSKSNTAEEILEKLDFYSRMGCEEFFIYDYRRKKFHAYLREGDSGLAPRPSSEDGTWLCPALG